MDQNSLYIFLQSTKRIDMVFIETEETGRGARENVVDSEEQFMWHYYLHCIGRGTEVLRG